MHQVYSSKPQQEYVVKGAMATCMFGVAPAMLNTIVDNMFVNFNGKLVATTMSLGPVFPTFGVCNMVPNMPKPCVCQIVKWDLADNSVTLNRIAHPLTKMSRGQCALGTPMCISFTMSGQLPLPSAPAVDVPVLQSDMNPAATNEKETPENIIPKVVKIEARNSEGKVISEIPQNGYATLVAFTEGHAIGDLITFTTKDAGPFYGYVEKDNKAYARDCFFGNPTEKQKLEYDNSNVSNTDAEVSPKGDEPANANETKEASTNDSAAGGDNDRSSESQSTNDNSPSDSNVENEASSTDSNVVEDAPKEKDKFSDALLKDSDAQKNIDLNALGRDAWDKPGNGFGEEFENDKVELYGLSKKQFLNKYKRTSKSVGRILASKKPRRRARSIDGYKPTKYGKSLTQADHKKMLKIRNKIYQNNIDNGELNESTVFQKVICCNRNIRTWLTGANARARDPQNSPEQTIVGSTLLAKDGKHLTNPAECYDGLQLNYGSEKNNPYVPAPPKCMYVLRYTTNNPLNAKIPVHDLNEVPKDMRDNFCEVPGNSYPFTGNGFTPSTTKKGGLGTPEVFVPYNTPQVVDDAVIVRIDEDGTETIVGYKTYKNESGRMVAQYVLVDEEGNYVEELKDGEEEDWHKDD